MASSFPALGVTTPKFDSPLTTLGQLANLRSQQTENMLRQQQISASQQQQDLIAQETAQKQRDVRDQNTVQSLVKNPANAADFGAGKLDFLTGQISPEYQNKLQEGVSKAHKEKSLASVEDLKLDAQHLQDATESLFGINQVYAKDPVAGAAAYTSARQLLIDKGNRYAMKAPAEIHSADELQAAEAGLGMTAGITSKALALKEAQAKNDLTAAQSTDAAAKARESGVKADKDQFELNLMKGAADGSQDAAIDKQFAGNPEAAQAAKNAWAANIRQPDGLRLAHEAVGKIYDQYIGDATKAKSLIPGKVAEQAALLPGEVKKAVATESATAPIKLQQSMALARALRAGDNPAVANVAPASIGQVQNDAIKADTEYATAKNAAEEMATFIDLARKGNKVAYAYAPTTGVLTINSANGTKRMNMSEVHQYMGAGSDFDKVQQFFGKHLTGASIDGDILSAMQQTHAALLDNSYKKYTGQLDSLNKRTGSAFKPTYEAPSGGGNSDMVSAQIPGQPAGQIHRSQRAQFLKDNPGATAGQ